MRVARWVKKTRAALEAHGMLVLSDAELPSLTTLVAGEPVRGSWWGHPKGKRIWHVLQVIDDEVATTRLVGGKVTLVHERLWPALARVGAERAGWQQRGLDKDARALLRKVDAAGEVRTDLVKPGVGWRKVGRVAEDLERRLLVASHQVHTESGRHARVLSTWKAFRAAHALRVRDLPKVREAHATLEAAPVAWVGVERARALLPWPA